MWQSPLTGQDCCTAGCVQPLTDTQVWLGTPDMHGVAEHLRSCLHAKCGHSPPDQQQQQQQQGAFMSTQLQHMTTQWCTSAALPAFHQHHTLSAAGTHTTAAALQAHTCLPLGGRVLLSVAVPRAAQLSGLHCFVRRQ